MLTILKVQQIQKLLFFAEYGFLFSFGGSGIEHLDAHPITAIQKKITSIQISIAATNHQIEISAMK